MNSVNINNMSVSFCTVVMNRLPHLKLTLSRNILDADNAQTEFVLLDYNSKDGLQKWIHEEFSDSIKSGRLVYYRFTGAKSFKRSHSRNLAFRLATQSILCNIDADNFVGKGFDSFILRQFSKTDSILLRAKRPGKKDTYGKFAVAAKDFIAVNGFDESMDGNGYGFEDIDIQNRLLNYGLKEVTFDTKEFTQFIPHGDFLRMNNEKFVDKLSIIAIVPVSDIETKFLYLYSDKKYEYFYIIDKSNKHSNDYATSQVYSRINNGNHDMTVSKILKGKWSKNSSRKITLYNQNKNYPTEILQESYHQVRDPAAILEFMKFRSEILNKRITLANLTKPKDAINSYGFGLGRVDKNFGEETKLLI